MIRKIFLAAAAWTAGLVPALAANPSPLHSSAQFNVYTLNRLLLSYGGVMADSTNGTYRVQQLGGSATSYPSLAALAAALGNTTVVSAGATYFDANGTMQSVAANTLRVGYDWTQAANNAIAAGTTAQYSTPLGPIMENQAVQSLTAPEDFSNVAWTTAGATRTDSAFPAPDGTNHATLLTETATGGQHWVVQSASKISVDTAGNPLVYAASCHFRQSPGDRNVYIYQDDGAGNSTYTLAGWTVDFDTGLNSLQVLGSATQGTGQPAQAAFVDQAGVDQIGITAASESGKIATFTTATTVGLSDSAQVVISSFPVVGYNGTWPVLQVLDATHFTATMGQSGLSPSSGGQWLSGANPWFRLSQVAEAGTGTTIRTGCGLAAGNSLSYTGQTSETMQIWGANATQAYVGGLETEVQPSSYISSKTTRVYDRFSLTLPAFAQGLPAYSEFVSTVIPRVANGLSNSLASLNDATGASYVGLLQNSPNVGGTFAQKIQGGTAQPGTGVNALAGPFNLVGQPASFASVAQSANYYLESSLVSSKTNKNIAYYPDAVQQFSLNSYGTLSPSLVGNVSYPIFAVFTGAINKSLLHNILYKVAPYNPDIITKPNYLTEAMLSQVNPVGMEIWKLEPPPPKDNTSEQSYAFYPVTHVSNQSIVGSINTNTKVPFQYLLWGGRCNHCLMPLWTDSSAGLYVHMVRPQGDGELWYTTAGALGPAPGVGKTTIWSGKYDYGVSGGLTLTVGKFQASASGPGYSPGDRLYHYQITGTTPADWWGNATTLATVAAPAVGTYVVYNYPVSLNGNANAYGGPSFTLSNGKVAVVSYSQQKYADAATKAIAAGALGYADHQTTGCPTVPVVVNPCGVKDFTAAVGIPDSSVYSFAAAKAADVSLFSVLDPIKNTWQAAEDTVVLTPQTLQSMNSLVWGIVLDNEMFDGRLASTELAKHQVITALVHNATVPAGQAKYQYGIAVDDWLGGAPAAGICGVGQTARYQNCDIENMTTILNMVDGLDSPNGRPPPRGYTFLSAMQTRLALLDSTANIKHLILQFNLGPPWPGGSTTTDAEQFAGIVQTVQPRGVWMTNTNTLFGGGECRLNVMKQLLALGIKTHAQLVADGCTYFN